MKDSLNKTMIRLKNSYHKRFDKDSYIKRLVRHENDIREIFNSLKSEDAEVIYWKNSYRDFFEKELNFLKGLLYLPRLIAKMANTRPDWYSYIKNSPGYVNSEIMNFRGLKLPKPKNDSDGGAIGEAILDVLLQHMLAFDESVRRNTDYEFYTTCPEGPYEYSNVFLSKGDIVIDAGACIGEFSALAVLRGGIPYAFEPMPSVIENYLSRTVELNPGITIAPYALSDKKGILEFNIDQNNLASSFVEGVKDKKAEHSYVEKIQAIDLDSFVSENNLPKVDFIKADIEGAERYMLAGAQGVLKEFAPKLALCTYHLPDDPQVMEQLILQANPKYIIEQKRKKLYAYVPDKK